MWGNNRAVGDSSANQLGCIGKAVGATFSTTSDTRKLVARCQINRVATSWGSTAVHFPGMIMFGFANADNLANMADNPDFSKWRALAVGSGDNTTYPDIVGVSLYDGSAWRTMAEITSITAGRWYDFIVETKADGKITIVW